MPVRTKATDKILDSVHIPSWAVADKLYESLIKSIDWNRVQLEAIGRCLKLHENLSDEDMPCGDCLEAVMLVKQTFPEWKED
jgi:hypothetical protein